MARSLVLPAFVARPVTFAIGKARPRHTPVCFPLWVPQATLGATPPLWLLDWTNRVAFTCKRRTLIALLRLWLVMPRFSPKLLFLFCSMCSLILHAVCPPGLIFTARDGHFFFRFQKMLDRIDCREPPRWVSGGGGARRSSRSARRCEDKHS